MQPWGVREGAGGRKGTRQRPRWDRWREGAGRRWAEPDGRAGATGGVGVGRPSFPPPPSPPPSAPRRTPPPGLWRADRLRPPGRRARARGARRGAGACVRRVRACAPRAGRAGGGTWRPAWRASPGRWVRRAAGCGWPGLRASALERETGEEGTARLASRDRTGTLGPSPS